MAIFKLDYNALWESICNWSRKAGRVATRPVLLMWYVMKSKDTPIKDKWAIFGSLAYLVLPIDILDSKRLPFIGWLDEVASLAVMIQKCQSTSLLKCRERRMLCLTNGSLSMWNMK